MPADAVHRLRARLAPEADRHDALAWRLRLSGLLDRTALHPAGLPPAAVLVVRTVTAAVPARAVRPGDGAAVHAAWERKVREHLGARARTAARPSRGRVPPDAEAVVFADVAEWLACLLADLGGGAAPRWWWPPRLRTRAAEGAAPGHALAALLCDEAPAVPPTVGLLARWDALAPAFRALTPVVAATVLPAVRAAYGVPEGGAGAGRAARTAAPHRGAPLSVSSAPDGDEAHGAPFHRLIPAGFLPTLAPVQAELLAVCLGVVRGPEARQPAARTAPAVPDPGTRTLHEQGGDGAQTAPPVTDRRDDGAPAGPSTAPPTRHPEPTPEASAPVAVERVQVGSGAEAGVASPAASAEREEIGAPPEAESPASISPARPLSRATPAHADEVEPVSPASRDRPAVTPDGTVAGAEPGTTGAERPPDALAVSTGVVERPEGAEGQENTETRTPPDLAFGDGIETALGGVLYLLNLLTHLDVPAAFAAWRTTGEPGPWALLDLVARGLLDDGPPSLADDPLWHALRQLDGRPPGVLPGHDVTGPPTVALPAHWLDADADTRGYWASRDGRLCVWRDAAYPVAVAPRDGGPAAAQARALLGVGALVRRSFAEAPLDPLTGPAAGAIPAGVRPWLAAVVPLLRHRLRLALGPEESVADVLRRPGRLYLTSSHVDLVQSVGAITLAVRRSGLDRDPGWLPAFGRVVYFHFDGPAHALR